MKKMRKIFAVLLTLAMVLAMSIPTFAAEVTEPVTSYSSKITVTGLSSQIQLDLHWVGNLVMGDADKILDQLRVRRFICILTKTASVL